MGKIISLYEFCIENELYKHLLDEWDYELNLGINIKEIGKSSHKKVYWKCKLGHSFDMRINNRTDKNKCNCPYCASKRLLVGFNDLKSVDKYLAYEFDYSSDLNDGIKSDMVFPKTNTIYNWRCVWCGNVYQQSLKYRRSGRFKGCPSCDEYCYSYNEFILLYYLSKYFNNVYDRFKYDCEDMKIELDIFIKDINVAIESDGYFVHSKKEKYNYDKIKDSLCKHYNIRLYRFREDGLDVTTEYPIIYNYKKEYNELFNRKLIELIIDIINYSIDNNYIGLKDDIKNILLENNNDINIIVNNDIIDVVRDFYKIEHTYRKTLK